MSTHTLPNLASAVPALLASSAGAQTAAAGLPSLLGRILFASIFLMAAPMHFTAAEIGYAQAAGVPFPHLLVPASGLLALAGALSVALGYRARLGAWLLVAFLVPVTLALHNFWAATDAATAQIQMAMFMKNVSILGAALLITQFGPGPWSLDARRDSRAAQSR